MIVLFATVLWIEEVAYDVYVWPNAAITITMHAGKCISRDACLSMIKGNMVKKIILTFRFGQIYGTCFIYGDGKYFPIVTLTFPTPRTALVRWEPPLGVKHILVFQFNVWELILGGGVNTAEGAGGCAIDPIYTTANTWERNNAMLQVPVPFSRLEMALSLPTNHSAQQSCPLRCDMSVTAGESSEKRKKKQKTEGNRHEQACEKCNGFC